MKRPQGIKIKKKDKNKVSLKFHQFRWIAGFIILCTLFVLLPACQAPPQEPILLQSIHQAPISKENPVSLSFRANGEGPILVQVIGHETEFESRITDTHGSVLNKARLPYIRLGPVYQLLGEDEISGEVTVQVSAIHQTKNANVSISVYQLHNSSRADRSLAQAYRHYSNAIQSTHSEAIELWRERVGELQQAAKKFRRAGLKEQALWSEWLLASFTYFPVSEFQQSIEKSEEIRVEAEKADLQQIVLAAVQLQGLAMMERGDADTPEEALAKLVKAQVLFKQTVELAGQLGASFERARAINYRGIAYYYQDSHGEALELYEQALNMALELQDAYLIKSARGNIATVNERQGDYSNALGAELAIKRELAHSGLPAERLHNLIDIGRLYSKLFLFPEAIEALNQAMALSLELNSKESSGRIGLSLAMAYYDMGQQQRAQNILLTAIDDMKDGHYGRGLEDAYRLLSDIDRQNKAYEQLENHREQQEQYLRSDREHADFLFSRGLDALARGELVQAGEIFSKSYDIAIRSENVNLQIRSLLHRCLLLSVSIQEKLSCESERLENLLTNWLPYASPRFALDARFTWVQFLLKQGEQEQALTELKNLIMDIRLYRSRLTGVLGAWYWESREKIFSIHLDLLLQQAQSPDQISEALTVLDQFRNSENSGYRHGEKSDLAKVDFNADKVRKLVAHMSRVQDDSTRQSIRREIDQTLLVMGRDAEYVPDSSKNLLHNLIVLPSDTAYLTYYFSKSDAWVWITSLNGVQLVNLAKTEPILELLGKVREGLQIVGSDDLAHDLDALGSLLLQPIETLLPPTIYLGASGALAGFPFEAIRLNGKYLVEDHMVINTMSLRGLAAHIKSEGEFTKWDTIFLAGAPVTADNEFVELSGAASEIEHISHLFSQQMVQKYAGASFNRSSFANPIFNTADLIHIASHGSINLEYPELSRLTLSRRISSDTQDDLTPLDILQHRIRADLVVLSACETTGLNKFTFDSNLGFVTEFLQAGAGAVVASLWPVRDQYTREFMRDFYLALLEGVGFPDALVMAKRKYVNPGNENHYRDWAAFQIYVN